MNMTNSLPKLELERFTKDPFLQIKLGILQVRDELNIERGMLIKVCIRLSGDLLSTLLAHPMAPSSLKHDLRKDEWSFLEVPLEVGEDCSGVSVVVECPAATVIRNFRL